MGENYWKHAYHQTWADAAEREQRVALDILEATGRKVVPAGLGTASTEFLPGAAERHGHERGAPDLHIASTNVFLEVTGPLASGVSVTRALWLRPDKIEHARRHMQQMRTVVIHCLGDSGPRRAIYLGSGFFRRFGSAAYPIEARLIRGRREHYVAVPAAAPDVRPWDLFVAWVGGL
jgi:hypothetical protein